MKIRDMYVAFQTQGKFTGHSTIFIVVGDDTDEEMSGPELKARATSNDFLGPTHIALIGEDPVAFSDVTEVINSLTAFGVEVVTTGEHMPPEYRNKVRVYWRVFPTAKTKSETVAAYFNVRPGKTVLEASIKSEDDLVAYLAFREDLRELVEVKAWHSWVSVPTGEKYDCLIDQLLQAKVRAVRLPRTA